MIDATNLPRSTPEAQGISSSAIQAFIDVIEQKQLGVHSLLLVRNGHIVADGWWKPYAAHLPHSMFSVSKSVTATAIGLARSEGRLTLDDPILSFFPSYVTPEISANIGTLQIRHLLSMSTGHAEDTLAAIRSADEDWVHTFLALPITYPPGTHFLYNNGATFMLSAILQSLTGQTLLEYLQPRLFQPLGIEKPTWQSNKSGINIGASGLSLRTIDLAKFGLLYLQRGIWNGQRIVPEEWIEEATTTQVANGDDPDADWSQGYGFQFWRSRHNSYRADGAFGQFCLVMPDYNAILALTCGTSETASVLNAVWDYILPGMSAKPLSESTHTTQEYQQLEERLAHLALPLPQVLAVEPPIATHIARRTLQFEPNDLHIHEVSFTFDNDTCTFTIQNDQEAAQQNIIHYGRTDWVLGKTPLWLHEEPLVSLNIVAHGGWVDDHTFAMTWHYTETPFQHIITFDFSTDGVAVSMRLDWPVWWVKRSDQLQGRLL